MRRQDARAAHALPMIFTSLTFVIFLIIVFATYWALPRQSWRNLLIVSASYVFYGWWDWRFCALMLATSMLDFALGLAINRTQSGAARRWLLVASIVSNLGALAIFKYFNFFVENAQMLAESMGFGLSWTTRNIVLPVGISFYTFQSLSYTIDVYRRNLPATANPIDFLAFVSFFPQLVAGPIERATHLLPQFQSKRTFDSVAARDGMRQMLWGAFKKMVIADNLARIVDPIYHDPLTAGGPLLALATICFAWQIYCDFSGYSDIAIGCAKLFDFRLMRNFAYPYFAQSVAEFWRRWHISLTTWFRDYLYIPLGGSRVGPVRRCLNVMITFVVSGFWHGAAWNFITWGAINGVATLPAILRPPPHRDGPRDIPGGIRAMPSMLTLARMLVTFVIICLTWVFFRSATFYDATHIIGRIATNSFGGDGWREVGDLLHDQRAHVRTLVYLGVLIVCEWVMRRNNHPLDIPGLPRAMRWFIYTIVLWTILYDGTGAVRAFIYFQF